LYHGKIGFVGLFLSPLNQIGKGWILNTILQESGNCHLYEKIGYRKTGEMEKIIKYGSTSPNDSYMTFDLTKFKKYIKNIQGSNFDYEM
jgi:hypothetical protein